MSALAGGLFDPVPVAPIQVEGVEEQEEKAVEAAEQEEEATVSTITTSDGAAKCARVFSSVAPLPSGILTLHDVLTNRDFASQLLDFPSSPRRQAFTSGAFIPNIKAALLRLPRLQEFTPGLVSFAAVLALVETIGAGCLRFQQCGPQQ